MGISTFLFTDVERSTWLWEQHPEAMKEALATHDELMDEVIEAHGGRIFKHTGDGIAAVFASPTSALEAAADIQQRIAANPHPDIGSLEVRIGVHAGETEERDGDFFGSTLNRTARLMAAAHGGQTLVSLVAARLAEDTLFRLRDLGEHRLRDLGKPERVFQLEVDGLPADFPPIKSLEGVHHNLPVLTTSFVGRDQELAELDKLVRGARLVTVTGVGGSGKTRLALHAAADLLPEFTHGVWLVELAAVTDPELIDGALASALGLTQESNQSLRQAAIGHLARGSALLVIDNCEHLIDAAAELVSELLAAVPNLKLLATSRELLGVPGEVTYGLRSMRLPPRDADRATLAAADSVRLFIERATPCKPDFRITDQNANHVVDICRRLDGMPLAIELAAARIRTFSTAQIAELLDQRFKLLTGGSRTALPRQQTLTATIEWSYRLLDDTERVLLRRLSVFQGGFTLEAAQHVCDTDPLDTFDVLELLPHLVDKSLVLAESDEEEVRYRLLETIRQFARDRLDETGEGEGLRQRHAGYYRQLTREAQRYLSSENEPIGREAIQREEDNIRAAMDWSLSTGDVETAVELVVPFSRALYRSGRWSEPLGWIERVKSETDESAVDEALRAELLFVHGSLFYMRGDLEAAEQLLGEAVAYYRAKAKDQADREAHRKCAGAITNLAIVLLYSGKAGVRNERYTELATQALEAARRAGDEYLISLCLANLAHHRDPAGDPEQARRLFAEAEKATRAVGSMERLAGLHSQRAYFEFNQKCFKAAAEAWQEAARLASSQGRTDLVPMSNVGAAAAATECGDADAPGRLVAAIRTLLDDPDQRQSNREHSTLLVFRAGVDAVEGRHERVAQAAGAVETATEDGVPVRWDLVDHFERVEKAARSALGDERFDELVDQGRAMEHDDVVSFLIAD